MHRGPTDSEVICRTIRDESGSEPNRIARSNPSAMRSTRARREIKIDQDFWISLQELGDHRTDDPSTHVRFKRDSQEATRIFREAENFRLSPLGLPLRSSHSAQGSAAPPR